MCIMRKIFYLVSLLFLTAIMASAQGPVVYLPLDTDLKDASGNGLDATDGGGTKATAFVEDAERGKVAYFDTTAFAVLPKNDLLRFGTGQDFSYALWMKIDPVNGDPAILGNKDWDNGRNKGFVMYVKNAATAGSSNFGINFCDGTTDAGGSGTRLYWTAFENGAPDGVDGTWHFVAVSFDRDDTLRVWMDGVQQVSTIAMSGDPGLAYDDVNDYPFTIMEDGTGHYNSGSGLKGYIDDLRIWNRALTDEDVKELYSSSAAEGPVVYLPLDTDLSDASGNGLDATDGGGTKTTAFVEDAERGKVAYFDTTAFAVLPKNDLLRFGTGQDFSYALWMKIDPVNGDPAILSNKDWDNGRNKGFVMYVKNAATAGSSNFGINFCDGTTDAGGSGTRLYWTAFENGAPDGVDGTWHFVAVSFDRDDTLRVWMDGVQQVSTIAMSGDPGLAYDDVNDYPFTIMEDGTGHYNSGSGLKGYIDELRVWDRALTNDEVSELYEDTKGTPTGVAEIETSSLNSIVYPNPAKGEINIKFSSKNSGNAKIRIYNAVGTLVKELNESTVSGKNLTTMNVSGWAPGIYFVRIASENNSETVRFVVSK